MAPITADKTRFPKEVAEEGAARRGGLRLDFASASLHGSPRCSAQEAQEDEEWGAELYETQQAHQGSDAVAWESGQSGTNIS